ncbi:MAG: hypothetical protein HN337_08155 [Deltaproteobacteria bacterium]|jgi:hypothetical protein|nr:hypothetical protein [Deltaproteobacteria bacterium]
MGGDVSKPRDVTVAEVKDVCCGTDDGPPLDLSRRMCRSAVDEWLVTIATERDESGYARTIDEVFERFRQWAGPKRSDSKYGSCKEVATQLMNKLRKE